MTHRILRASCAIALLTAAALAVSPVSAAADDPQAPPARPGSSPVVVEQVQDSPVFGADVKYTRVNDRDGILIGGHGGVLVDRRLLLGGAAYWLANGDDRLGMTYGGALVEWYALRGSAVSVSLGGLIGGGVATVSTGYGYPAPMERVQFGHGGGTPAHYPDHPGATGYMVWDQGFFLAEPQVNVVFHLTPGMALVAGAGYRLVGAASGFEDQIRGVTGNVSVRFGGGK